MPVTGRKQLGQPPDGCRAPGRRATVRRRDKEHIDRLEQTGAMDQRREEIRGWFEKHPHASALDAIQALRYCRLDPDGPSARRRHRCSPPYWRKNLSEAATPLRGQG